MALSTPAQSVVIGDAENLDVTIKAERDRRRALKEKGRPYHYWRERGDAVAPREEHWCDRCVGFYGVPHDKFTHTPNRLCRSLGHAPDCRQCACLECVVYEAWSAARV